jgi:hypothetical protein
MVVVEALPPVDAFPSCMRKQQEHSTHDPMEKVDKKIITQAHMGNE